MLAVGLYTTVINITVLKYNVRSCQQLLTVQVCLDVTLCHWVSGHNVFNVTMVSSSSRVKQSMQINYPTLTA
jgi:tryptophanase